MMTDKQALRECQVFSVLSNAQLEEVTSSVIEKQYDGGTTIFQEGDSAEELLVIQEGKVALQMTLPNVQVQMGRRITVDIVTGNEVIGWEAIIEPYIYTLTAICMQKVRILSINGNKLRGLLQGNSNIGYMVLKGITKMVASRLEGTSRMMASERVLIGVR